MPSPPTPIEESLQALHDVVQAGPGLDRVASHLLPNRAFYFLRHGETQYNRERRFQGSIDVPLNETGVAQARQAARNLSGHKFTRIISSPANRVLKTASFIAEASGAPIHIDADLMEFYVGSFEGQRITAIMKAYGLAKHDSIMSILPDDADKWHELVPRICAAVKRWTDRHAGETLLIAAHGLVFRALTESLIGERPACLHAVPYHFRPNENGWDLNKVE